MKLEVFVFVGELLPDGVAVFDDDEPHATKETAARATTHVAAAFRTG
jgi:hypothetical protein